jgi:pyruvate decarboxylase
MHHTMAPNMDHTTYITMAAPIRTTHCILTDPSTMASEIDRTIITCVQTRLPVYIYVPTDVVSIPLDSTRLSKPLDLTTKNDPVVEEKIVEGVLEAIKSAERPVVLADVLAIRHGGEKLCRELVDIMQVECFSTPLSKGVFDETSPYYNGLYNGEGTCTTPFYHNPNFLTIPVSFPGVASSIETSDLVLNIAPLLSDSNTGGFTRHISDSHLIRLGHDFCQIREQKFENTHFLSVLRRLVSALQSNPSTYNLPRPQNWQKLEVPILSTSTSGKITQNYIWQRLGRFLTPNDIVLAEAGTAQFGMPDAIFPANTKYITQTYWSSIGYTVGACLGALVAAKELSHPGRVVLVVGEGSLQMTVQEIGTYIRYGFKPVIFVINNNGYAIERAIWGPEQEYNDVSMLWDHQKMLEFFGARQNTGIKSSSCAVKTVEELEKVLEDKEFGSGDGIKVCGFSIDALSMCLLRC